MAKEQIVGTWLNTLHHVPTAAKAGIIAGWQADPDFISYSEMAENDQKSLWTLVGVFGAKGA